LELSSLISSERRLFVGREGPCDDVAEELAGVDISLAFLFPRLEVEKLEEAESDGPSDCVAEKGCKLKGSNWSEML